MGDPKAQPAISTTRHPPGSHSISARVIDPHYPTKGPAYVCIKLALLR